MNVRNAHSATKGNNVLKGGDSMHNFRGFLLGALSWAFFLPGSSYAQGFAPEMYGVGEVVIEYPRFEDPEAASVCHLSRDDVDAALNAAFSGSSVPVTPVAKAKPLVMGVARIHLIPELSSHSDENLGCVSWISLSAESRTDVIIPPISAPRSVTIVYWRMHGKAFSNQSVHPQKASEVLRQMAQRFIQQYKIDQPSAPKQ